MPGRKRRFRSARGHAHTPISTTARACHHSGHDSQRASECTMYGCVCPSHGHRRPPTLRAAGRQCLPRRRLHAALRAAGARPTAADLSARHGRRLRRAAPPSRPRGRCPPPTALPRPHECELRRARNTLSCGARAERSRRGTKSSVAFPFLFALPCYPLGRAAKLVTGFTRGTWQFTLLTTAAQLTAKARDRNAHAT